MRAGGEFCQVYIFAELVCHTVEGQFFLALSKSAGRQVDLTKLLELLSNVIKAKKKHRNSCGIVK
jgi:hypothetical protein